MKTKEYNPKESIQIFETILFTNITVSELRKTPLIQLAAPLMIISNAQNLNLFFTDRGIMCSRVSDYKSACSFLEKSVLYN